MFLPVISNIYERDKWNLSFVTGTCKQSIGAVGINSELPDETEYNGKSCDVLRVCRNI